MIIEYRTPYDTIQKSHITLFDMTVSEVLYASAENQVVAGKTISVGVPYSSHRTQVILPEIEEGKEFLIFTKKTTGMDNSIVHYKEFVDYWTKDPLRLMIEKAGDYYVASSFFEENRYTNSAMSVRDEMELSESETHEIIEEITYDLNMRDSTLSDSMRSRLVRNADQGRKSNISEKLKKEGKYPHGILEMLVSRSGGNAHVLWNNLSINYVFEPDEFRTAIKQKAATFKSNICCP